MVASIFVYFNIFVVVVFGLTFMVSDFNPATTRKMIIGSALLVLLPITAVAIMNMQGIESHRVDDLIFMRGGALGILVVIGYGIAFGLLMSKLRRIVVGEKKVEQDEEQ